MRGKGVSKDKNYSTAGEQSSNINCGRQCLCHTKARLAHKHEMNQRMAEYMMENESNSSRSESISTVTEEMIESMVNNYQEKDVDELVSIIEGKSSANEKKKIKKERQKQERINAMRKQESKIQKVPADQARNTLLQQYNNLAATNESTKPQLSKKQLKKSAQKMKKLMEEATSSNSNQHQATLQHQSSKLTDPLASSPLDQVSNQIKNITDYALNASKSNMLSSIDDLKSELQNLCNPSMSLEDIKTRLSNIAMNTSNKSDEQSSTTYQQKHQSFNPAKFDSQNTPTNLEFVQNLEQLKAKHQRELELLQLKHKQAIEEEELKAMHRQKEHMFMQKQNYDLSQFKMKEQSMNHSAIGMPNVETKTSLSNNTIRVNNSLNSKTEKKKELNCSSKTGKVANETSEGSRMKTNSSRNTQEAIGLAKIANCQNEVKSEPRVPNINSDSMVTIRRVNGQFNTSPTVTITQPIKSKDNKKIGDKLLYTVVNGEILKAHDAPNLIPGAKPMPLSNLREA